ncbi:MAG: hypothetical protein H6Q13_311 [Bacteroidetes bacterium]|nr:hypothetical protein [Bacteroidota bacterium]
MNVLIVEDEKFTAQLLKEMIEEDSDFLVTTILGSIVKAVQFLSKHQNKIDLIFLDIQLEDGYSFEIFKHIDVTIPVIFCTAYDEYTLQAIKNNGIEYILKPFKEGEIQAALTKFKRLVGSIQAKSSALAFVPVQQANTYQESFLTQLREKSFVVYIKDVAVFALEFETVYMYTSDGKKYPLFKNLEYVEKVCNPQVFFRINRQMIVNRAGVISIQAYFNRKIVVHLKVQLPEKAIVSRLKVSSFKEWLEKS